LRRILVDSARERRASKRRGGVFCETLTEGAAPAPQLSVEVLDLHLALEKLAGLDPRTAQVIELRYFGGLTLTETAEVLEVSVATIKRDWEVDRAFLIDQLSRVRPQEPDSPSQPTEAK